MEVGEILQVFPLRLPLPPEKRFGMEVSSLLQACMDRREGDHSAARRSVHLIHCTTPPVPLTLQVVEGKGPLALGAGIQIAPADGFVTRSSGFRHIAEFLYLCC